ncbi:MAG: iron-containing alcohol dehydrogenase [Uliginosibacterium sp.]|nr:iron-containing alcohol dehydrogenase [Uliginosibacterium sp.]
MSAFLWHNPVRVVFGTGTLDMLPELVGKRSVLLVTFRSAQDSGLLARLKSLLGDRIVEIVDKVPSQPELDFVRALHAQVWAGPAFETVVAVGGGSVLDAGKALSCRPARDGFDPLLSERCEIATRRPVIAVPTTAGSGSEVTPFATLWNGPNAKPAKQILHLPELWPESALVDPELTLSLPRQRLRNAALDTLARALEAIWNRKASPLTDRLAVQAARGVLENLPKVWRYPGNLAARSELALAALRAGQCACHTRTALAHALSNAVSAIHGTPHGLACAFSLPWVWRQAQGNDPERDAVLAEIFGRAESDPATRLEAFLHQLDVPTDFAAYGLAEEGAQRFAEFFLTTPQGRNFIARPSDPAEATAQP